MCRLIRLLGTSIILAVICISAVHADGFMLPVHQPTVNVFSVKYHHVDVFIDGQAATTKVDQIFHNETAREEEGTYIFPLPKGAAINKFSMFVGETEQQGKVLDRDEARRMYESIVRQRKDPALLEYMDRNTFKARVYPIPANGDKRIRLQYTEVVKKTGSISRYVYPLSTERFSAKPLDDVRVTIRLRSRTRLSNIYSPSHVVQVEQSTPNEAVVTWTAKNVKPDQDLILYYSQASGDMAVDVLAFRDRGEKGYFMLLASPKIAAGKVMPKNVIFVLDRTGSMAGDKIVQAKGALKYCLNSLKPQDRFSLITFNESADPLWKGLRPAADKANVKAALSAVDRTDATGGTNLNAAVESAMSQLAGESRSQSNYVVFLTDGLPTVGEQSIEKILGNAKSANKAGARVFSFGVGYDVNTHLLDLLTEQTGGVPSYVLPNENIETSVSAFFAGISEPVLTDIEISAEPAVSGMRDVHLSEMLPGNPIPALFNGSQLVVVGRYDTTGKSGKAVFTLRGKTPQGVKTWKATADLPARDTERDFVPQIWAARKIGFLLDQVRLHRNDELIKEIVRLSKDWGIPTEFTSYFVDEPMVAMDEAVSIAGASMNRARDVQSGTWGVSQTMNSYGLKNQNQVMSNSAGIPMDSPVPGAPRLGNARAYFNERGEAVQVANIQNVGTRTFYQRGSQWVDNLAESADLKTVKIKQFSNAHFKLLAASPDLTRYQSLGNMRLFVNNQALEIGGEGREDLSDAEVKAILGDGKPTSGVVPSSGSAPLEASSGVMGLGLAIAAVKKSRQAA